MEQPGEEMAANDVGSGAECKTKDSDLPLKLEGHNILGSPGMYVSSGNYWPNFLPHVYADTQEATSLNRCVTSLAGSEPPWTSPCSLSDTGVVVDEFSVRNYRISNTAVGSSNSRGGMPSEHYRWQHLYQLVGGSRSKSPEEHSMSMDKNRMLFGVREGLRRMPFDIRDLRLLSSKRINQAPEEISAHLKYGHNKIMLSNTMPPRGSRLKPLSTSSFSQYFIKKAPKSKGVVCRNQETPTGSGVAAMSQNEEMVYEHGVASDTFLNSSANNNRHSSHGFSTLGLESSHDGVSLREWLKPGAHRLSIVDSLDLFKKIVELVDLAHSQGVALQDLRPSRFILSQSKMVKYTGSLTHTGLQSVMYKKRPLEQDMHVIGNLVAKQQKPNEDINFPRHQHRFTSKCDYGNETVDDTGINVTCPQDYRYTEHMGRNSSNYQSTSIVKQRESIVSVEMEERWYASPEEHNSKGSTFPANIYRLGVLLFELLCCFESLEKHSAAMLCLRHRILPPNILSENPKEAGFCLWLLHPESSSRPTTREILQSELLFGSHDLHMGDNLLILHDDDKDDESELLLHFLNSIKEYKQKKASKLLEDLGCLEADIQEVERRNILITPSVPSRTHKDLSNSSDTLSSSHSVSSTNDARLMRNISQLENAYFSMRSQIQHTEARVEVRSDKDLLKNREKRPSVQNENKNLCINKKPTDCLGPFFEGLCKFACYSKFEVCGMLRNGDLLNSSSVICSLSLDRDEDYIAAAGVSKKIKIFEYDSLLKDTIDIHYPVVEMSNKSKLSCICWNNYIKNYLASSDYDGVVKMWDASTGQGFSQYIEHQKRAWSVDFSQVDPTKFASGSDDCLVKLWSINEKNSTSTIWNPANICCLQFSAYSTHLLAFGSADYKIYCYDLRHTRIPWCTLPGHGKAVSYVKFMDSDTLVSASTDNTLKLWDLNKTSPVLLSHNACSLTFTGHTNEKNFVGLSILDGYIACGSETNKVYTYYRSMPMPITSYNFGSVDSISGHEIADDNGQFVSSVCWRGKSNTVVAANSSGTIKILRMV